MEAGSDRVVFLDCLSGASGDMLAASLLDVAARAADGRPFDVLDEVVRPALAAAAIDPGVVTVAETRRGGLSALCFEVDESEGFATFADLIAVVERSTLAEDVAADAIAVAQAMAAAERRVHGENEPHLHELAGLDTAVDILAVSSLIHEISPTRVVATPTALGGGTVHTSHGEMPVPTPAVLALLEGLPTSGGGEDVGELTTPTGAALLAHFVDDFAPLPAGRIVAAGAGAGRRELAQRANILRAVVIERASVAAPHVGSGMEAGPATLTTDDLELLETNLDDLSPELLAHAADALRAAGALDVWFTNALMKKGRPGVVLHALVGGGDRGAVAATLFAETSTFGVRVVPVGRIRLDERHETIEIGGSDVRVRLGFLDGRLITTSPEYEDCAAVAASSGEPVKQVYERAQAEALRRFGVD